MFVCFYFGTQKRHQHKQYKHLRHWKQTHPVSIKISIIVSSCIDTTSSSNRGAFCVIIWKYEFRLTIRLFKGQEVCHLFEFSRPAELVCKPAEKKQTWKSLMPVYSHDSTLWFSISPERLISVRESLVVVPAAVSRLTDWSLIWLQ